MQIDRGLSFRPLAGISRFVQREFIKPGGVDVIQTLVILNDKRSRVLGNGTQMSR